MMASKWTAETLLNLLRGFQPACILGAAADLDVFSVLAERPLMVSALAQRLETDQEALRVLLDALVACWIRSRR